MFSVSSAFRVGTQGLLELDLSHCPEVTNGALSQVHRMVSGSLAPLVGPHIEASPLAFKLLTAMAARGEVSFSLTTPEGCGTEIRVAETIAAERLRTKATVTSAAGSGAAAALVIAAASVSVQAGSAHAPVAMPNMGKGFGHEPSFDDDDDGASVGTYDVMAEEGFFDSLPDSDQAYRKPPYRRFVDKDDSSAGGGSSTCFRLQQLRLRSVGVNYVTVGKVHLDAV